MGKIFYVAAGFLLLVLFGLYVFLPWLLGVVTVGLGGWFFLQFLIFFPVACGFYILLKNMPRSPAGGELDLTGEDLKKEGEEEGLSPENLVGSLAHELRKPLSRLKLKVEESPSELLELEETINLVEEVFRDENFSPGWISVPRLFKMLVEEFPASREIKFKIETGWIEADRKQLKLALENIIRNSIQAYGEEDGKIEIRVFCSGPEWCIRITDKAGGIDEKLARTISSAGSVEGAEGMGLGLLLVKKICKNHGGRLLIESKQDEGTEVTITLPWPVGN